MESETHPHAPHFHIYEQTCSQTHQPLKMANLRRASKDKDNIVGRFKLDGYCKKHPKHVQSPGVCSLCLRDKLSQLPSTSQKTTSATVDSSCASTSSSLSSYYSSSSGSSCSSPMHHHNHNPLSFSTTTTTTGSSVSVFLLPKHGGGLVKSRSMAVAPRRRKIDNKSDVVDNSKKKSGFWFKLLHPKSKRKQDHKLIRTISVTVRETVNVAN